MTTVTLSSLAAALENYAALMPKSVVATVLAAIDATTFQLLVKDSTIVVKSDVPLTIGASVELAVDSNGQTPTYTLVAKTADPQRALPQNVPATTAAIDRPAQPLRREQRSHLVERDMGGHMAHPHRAMGQQHHRGSGAGQRRQQKSRAHGIQGRYSLLISAYGDIHH